jgi:hypothetical protein
MAYTNLTNFPLSVAAWLVTDNYDYNADPNYLSATTLIRPLKSIILMRRVQMQQDTDISDLIASKLGTAVHDGIETSWTTNYKRALEKLGYPKKVQEAVLINPDGPIPDGAVPIYIERRSAKKVGNFTIGGKFDFVMEGKLEDFKTTSTYSWITQSNKDSYILQGSIYRWLNQDIIASDRMSINYIFTDWTATKALQDKSYPQNRIIQQDYPLLSIAETERYIKNRLSAIEQYADADQKKIPDCTQKELWQKDPVFKYFKNPAKMQRSTKNYTTRADAEMRKSQEGVGVVIEVPGEVKRCIYCSARPLCTQAEDLELKGLLK